MDHPQQYNNYLSLLHEHHELIPQVVEQIRKDFGDLIVGEPAAGTNAYEQVYQWIFPVMQRLYKNDRRRFTSLMYTVDAAFMKNKFGQRTQTELELWTHAVLMRECLKVFIRNNYRV